MKEVFIYGAGGLGREVRTLIEHINAEEGTIWHISGFIDDNPELVGQEINGLEVLGGVDYLNQLSKSVAVAIAIGDGERRKRISKLLTNDKIQFPSFIHPGVIIGDKTSISIARGCIIGAGSILTTDIQLGAFSFINLNVTVGHDVVLEPFTSLMPGCNISGEVILKEGAFLGSGVTVINRCAIGAFAIIGAGAVVNQNIPERVTAVGVPAKIIKSRNGDSLERI